MPAALLGAGLGIATGLINDWRQLNLQGGLNKQQEEMNKRMMDYQTQKQVEMWERTGYGPTVEQMKKAGINPALLYGMGGAGGQTTGGEMPTGTAPHAHTRGEELGMGMQTVMQMKLLQAQKENIEADTKLKQTTATKTEGVDTREAEERIGNIAQSTDNARQQHQIQKLDITLKNIENFEKQATQEDRLKQIRIATQRAGQDLAIITNDAQISEATKDELIKITQQKLIGAVLTNALTGAQIGATTAAAALDQQKIKESINDIMIKWNTLGNEQQRTLIETMYKHFQTDPVNQATDQISRLLDNIFFITSKLETIPKRNPIGFK